MKILRSLALVLAFASVAAGQVYKEEAVKEESSRQVADMPASYFGPFRVNGDKPRGFEGFDFFILGYKEAKDADKDERDVLVPDKQGNVTVRGELVTAKGTPLAFETVKLTETGPVTFYYKGPTLSRITRAQPIRLSFTTVEVKGVKYAFSGEYLDEPDEEAGGFTYLRGTFTKYKNGKPVAEAKTNFRRLAYQELTQEREPPPASAEEPPSGDASGQP
ncbi:MAG TPA: hypothetical protein VF064_11545 [Pyrinomonadaceae bacterium]